MPWIHWDNWQMRGIRQGWLLVCAVMLGACAPALDWREFRADEGAFGVLMPQRPSQAERKLVTPAGEVTMKMYSVRVDETVLGAGFADFASPPDAATQAAMQAALLKNLDGTVISDKPVGSGVPGMPAGREVVKRGLLGQGTASVPGELRARFYVRDNRYYQLVVIGRQGALPEADIDMFMVSLKPG